MIRRRLGIDEEKIDRSIKTALKDSDEIIRAAEAKKNGNYAEYEKLVSEIEKEGLSRKQAVSADKFCHQQNEERGGGGAGRREQRG